MDRIELHDLEYGDCTVLVGRDQSVLMVDCGSVNQYVRQGGAEIAARFDAVFRRYTGAKSRSFLLTHYHRDHMNGFLRQLRQDPLYFDRILLPQLPTGPLLTLALFARFFAAPQSNFAQVNTACLTVFGLLPPEDGAERIRTLAAGDAFWFDRTLYRVLSPGADFPYAPALSETAEALREILAVTPGCGEFLRAADAFLTAYDTCQTALSPAAPAAGRMPALAHLTEIWQDLEALRGTAAVQSASGAVQEILQNPALRVLYTETQNDLSLVFHNERTHTGDLDILLPGDASAAVLDRLAPQLYDSYYAVKAPHHGTESHWSDTLGRMEIGHLLLTNGEYHAGSPVSGRYTAMESVKHCTNPSACGWFRENGSCCNRLLRCFEQPAAGNLTLKCTAAPGNRRTPCNIYVFGHNGVRGCHCDR